MWGCKVRKIDVKHQIKSFWKSSLERIADLFDFASNRYDIKTFRDWQFQEVEPKTTKNYFAIKVMETRMREGREVCESEVPSCGGLATIPSSSSWRSLGPEIKFMWWWGWLQKGSSLMDSSLREPLQSRTLSESPTWLLMAWGMCMHWEWLNRDLKPEKLLRDHPGVDSYVLITDVDLAHSRNKGGDWTVRMLCGTPEYIAPEVLLRKSYTSSVDTWIFGLTEYVLLGRSLSFDDESHVRLYRKILKKAEIVIQER